MRLSPNSIRKISRISQNGSYLLSSKSVWSIFDAHERLVLLARDLVAKMGLAASLARCLLCGREDAFEHIVTTFSAAHHHRDVVHWLWCAIYGEHNSRCASAVRYIAWNFSDAKNLPLILRFCITSDDYSLMKHVVAEQITVNNNIPDLSDAARFAANHNRLKWCKTIVFARFPGNTGRGQRGTDILLKIIACAAIANGHLRIVRWCISKSVQLTSDEGLVIAATWGQTRMCAFFVSRKLRYHGVVGDIVDVAIIEAIRNNNPNIVQCLIAHRRPDTDANHGDFFVA